MPSAPRLFLPLLLIDCGGKGDDDGDGDGTGGESTSYTVATYNVGLATGYVPPAPSLPIVFLAAQALVVLTFAVLLSCRFTPAIAGSMALLGYAIAWLGGQNRLRFPLLGGATLEDPATIESGQPQPLQHRNQHEQQSHRQTTQAQAAPAPAAHLQAVHGAGLKNPAQARGAGGPRCSLISWSP